MAIVFVELNDDITDKDEFWAKFKHRAAVFKSELPTGVLALVTNDDFGDTSAMLITIESKIRPIGNWKIISTNLKID